MSSGHPTSPRLILASTSPYRKALLHRLRIPFDTLPPLVDETPRAAEAPQSLALRLAVEKAHAVSAMHPGAVVIGSDQVAVLSGRPIGKPGSHDRAVAQLRDLSGQDVAFHTALAVTDGARTEQADIVTRCRFRRLTDAAIEAYLRAEQPYDTAGSAKAESLGIALMESISSDDPTAIIGLPLIALTGMLIRFGIDPLLAAEGAR
jgi:septum formation protein